MFLGCHVTGKIRRGKCQHSALSILYQPTNVGKLGDKSKQIDKGTIEAMVKLIIKLTIITREHL